ncbi:MAG: NADH-quinone oxidoreductase subunit L, partial [Demequina sp.]
MSRVFFMTFHGKARWTDDQHPHDPSLLMTVPMMILAVGSAFLGLFLGLGDRFTSWLEPVTGVAEHHDPVLSVPVIIATTMVLVVLGVFAAWRMYVVREVASEPSRSLAAITARNDLFQDQINEGLIQRPGQHLMRTMVYADSTVMDGAVNKPSAGLLASGERLRKLQTGRVRSYAATMLVGLVIVVIIVLQGGL